MNAIWFSSAQTHKATVLASTFCHEQWDCIQNAQGDKYPAHACAQLHFHITTAAAVMSVFCQICPVGLLTDFDLQLVLVRPSPVDLKK